MADPVTYAVILVPLLAGLGVGETAARLGLAHGAEATAAWSALRRALMALFVALPPVMLIAGAVTAADCAILYGLGGACLCLDRLLAR